KPRFQQKCSTQTALALSQEYTKRVQNFLKDWVPGLLWGPEQIKEDLDKRDIGYAGEEVGKVEKLSKVQILPSLPPQGRGGSVRLVDWVSASTRRLLEDPRLSEVEDLGQEIPRLQGRVHIAPGEQLGVASLLVERGICGWYPESEVFRFRGTAVKNGVFGVVKPGKSINGLETLRVIMNLIPSNSLHSIIPGAVHRLPTIAQWTSICLGEGEKIEVSQADITSAFYLFELPTAWHRRLAFNIDCLGSELGEGFQEDVKYTLCAKVLPMGWNSAVGVMEEAAENLLRDIGLPERQSINRVQLLPAGFVEKMSQEDVEGSPFWHIYLDNYASGQRVRGEVECSLGGELHTKAEEGWNARGILTAPQKSVHRATVTTELGAYVQGERGWIGVDPNRLEKTLKLSIDASMTAGAVGLSEKVSNRGRDFLYYAENEEAQGVRIPVLLISLFDGIGGAARSYNVAGARPALYVSIEIHKASKRVVSRRWPEAVSFEDVKKVGPEQIREWIARAGDIKAIHVWGGFPCKDLSGAKAGRLNLQGEHSSLFYQMKRIWKEVQR
ncbi:unnamed protein product, partial [Durusdinium trenchii]